MTNLKSEVFRLAARVIDRSCNHLHDPSRAEAFAQQFGYRLPNDLLEWLQVHNGGGCEAGVLLGLMRQEVGGCWDILVHTKYLLEAHRRFPDDRMTPDPVALRLAAIATDGLGNDYFLTCEPDAHGCRPVYFVAHDPVEYYLVASDLWYFLYGFLLKAEYWMLHKDDEDYDYSFWWPYEREQVLAFDPALRYYEGTGLLPWEEELQDAD